MPVDLSDCATAVLTDLDFLLSAVRQLSKNKNLYRRNICLYWKNLI